MNFLTHIMISKTLYRHLSQKMDLDRKAFFYGNIKPDLSPQCLRNPHILENYLFPVYYDSNRLIRQNTPGKEFSVELGEICHYICDFFCYYHVNSKIYHKLFYHFLYEIRLQMILCSLPVQRKINFMPGERNSKKSIGAMIIELRKEYIAKRKSPLEDIEYAFLAAIWVCESILSEHSAGSAATADSAYPTAFYSPSRV